MVILVDARGREVDVAHYKVRLSVPPARQVEIRDYLASLESIAQNSRYFLEDFLRYCTYAENLLDNPYSISQKTFKLMESDRGSYKITEGSLDSYHHFTYYLAKMIRLGANVHLSEEEKRIIVAQVERLYLNRDYSNFIKGWNRNKDLGLPFELPEERKQELERYLDKTAPGISTFKIWRSGIISLLAAAKRCDLSLPKLDSRAIDEEISLLIWQDEQKFREHFEFGDTETIPMEFRLREYIGSAHHLRRLFNGA